MLEHALRPLFAYLRAVVVPTAVFAATEDFARRCRSYAVERFGVDGAIGVWEEALEEVRR